MSNQTHETVCRG